MENRIPLRTYFDSLLQRVELQIQDYEDNAGDPLTLCRQCVDYLQEALGELKAFVVAYRFASPEEEIHFFKAQKPHLVSKIIYYNTVYQTELRFPSGSVEVQKAYLRSEIILVDNFHYETDPQFSTSYDFKTAKIIANGLLEIYLTNRLNELDKREQRKEIKNGYAGKPVRWTGTKRALVELIYALDTVGCLNKGTLDIKEIVAYFEEMLDIDLGDFYHCYMELKAKAKDSTSFLTLLRERLRMRMDEQD